MRFLQGFIFACLSITAFAQSDMLFKEAPTEDALTMTFSGMPAILVENARQEKTEINLAESLPPPQWDTNIQIPITTPFGHQRTASFIDHITDFVSVVDILDRQKICIEEHIQFINTKGNNYFQWTLPPNAQILNFFHKGKSASFQLENDVLTGTTLLIKGIEQYTIRYIVSDRVKINKSLAELNIPIIEGANPLMIERFSLILNLPQKTPLYTNKILFGSNNQEIPEQIKMTLTNSGALYQTTHPLPAFSEIKLNLEMDLLTLFDNNSITTSHLIIISYTLIILLYTLLSIRVARRKKWNKVLSTILKLKSSIEEYDNKNQKTWIKNILLFFKFNRIYCFEILLLILFSYFIIKYFEESLSLGLIFCFIIISLLSLFFINLYGTRRSIDNLKEQFYLLLMTTPQGINLPPKEIMPYYLLALHFGFGKNWKEKVLKNNPNYHSFFKEEKGDIK